MAFASAIQDNKYGFFAQFGGQGFSQYFEELNQLYKAHTPLLQSLIDSANTALKSQAHLEEAQTLGFYKHGIEVKDWLSPNPNVDHPIGLPHEDYLNSSPISYPLIFLSQMCHYLVAAKSLFPKPEEDPIQKMRSVWKGATGHSQGVVGAVVISISDNVDSFIRNTCTFITYLFWQGARLQQAFQLATQSANLSILEKDPNVGKPTPLLTVLGLPVSIVKRHVDKINHLFNSSNQKIELSLINGPRAVVCSGNPATTLPTLVKSLQQMQAKPDEDQSRVPHSKRKMSFRMKYLSVSVPFHSNSILKDSVELILADIARCKLDSELPKGNSLSFPVYSTFDGSDLRSSANLMKSLVEMQAVQPVNWSKALSNATRKNGISHIIDFGPGGLSGAGNITARLKEGTGVITILATSEHSDSRTLSKESLFSPDKNAITFGPWWEVEYAPRLVKSSANGDLMLDTKFSRLIGKPPIMVAGMTPTTANEQIVAAFTNGGYHGELAGGGQATEEIYRDRIHKLTRMIKDGEGIHVNLLFLNPKLWGFQFPMTIKMRKDGIPIDSITVAAGIPTLERANEIIESIRESGMRYISFKPGSVNAIRDVIKIAKANKDINIVIQWTGGRSGGHHSFEDTYEPIIETYSSIRRNDNIVLIIGGGIGDDHNESLSYLNGSWSSAYGYPPMPFDGILIGSRVMVAKEALTSHEAKELIVKTSGVHDKEWEKSYDDDAGGVITVISELGEPIHKIATRGVLLWREFDKRFFTLPIDKQEKSILDNKDYIISRINNDYQKPYFGKNKHGSVTHLESMTYSEVLERMIELMYIEGEWIHSSYKDRFISFLLRTEERLLNTDRKQTNSSIVRLTENVIDPIIDDNPLFYLRTRFYSYYPSSIDQLLLSEDVDYFINLCRDRGKPVNFIPVIDKDLSFWFKKDSLWQSENLKYVIDKDVQRVCILQGPVSVKYCTKVDEPISDILGNINIGIVNLLHHHQQQQSIIPSIDYLGFGYGYPYLSNTKSITGLHLDERTVDKDKILLRISQPQSSNWLDQLLSIFPHNSWWRSILLSPQISTGKSRIVNRLPQLLKPHTPNGNIIEFEIKSGSQFPDTVKVFESNQSNETVKFTYSRDTGDIGVSVKNVLQPVGKDVILQLTYKYNPLQGGYSPIHMMNQNDVIKSFYYQLWFPNDSHDFRSLKLSDTYKSKKIISRSDILKFCDAIGSKPLNHQSASSDRLRAPIDYVIVACWESMIKTLFPPELDANLLSLLHLSYGYNQLTTSFSLMEGDTIESSIELTEVMNLSNGKRVSVKGLLYKEGQAIIEVNSQFFFPGVFNDFHTNFRKRTTQKMITIHDAKIKAVLLSKEWLKLLPNMEINVGDKILVTINSNVKPLNEKVLKEVVTTGNVMRYKGTTKQLIADISYTNILTPSTELPNKEATLLTADPVEMFVDRYGKPNDHIHIFEDGGYPVDVPNDDIDYASPKENTTYSIASGDHNPIHTNQYISDLAGLPATITHGMWNAAYTRNLIDLCVSKKLDRYSVKSYSVNFMEKVKPCDKLFPRISHVGMKNGRKMIQIEILNEDETPVLKASAEVDQPRVAYVFTGQGSAEIGMGMDLYKSSPVAKDIWDKAEQHMMENFGFSIIGIINKNPKEITIFFGGPKGSAIRENYMRLKHEIVTEDESGKVVRKLVNLFPEINDATESYTFHHPEGLLYATQFTQPALTLVEKASFADMQSKGLIPYHDDSIYFAGHSLGEYAALASVANVLSVENLVELVFIRGITMQNAVSRDDQGRSNYGMVAVNPQRVGAYFTADDMHNLVNEISNQSGKLLQVVNYNVDNWQYIVTGHNYCLEGLRLTCNTLKSNPLKKEDIPSLVRSSLSSIDQSSSFISIESGVATIPLPGIDVPFHSRSLLGEVPRFREYLMKTLSPKTIDLNLLEGKYIPNLTAVPFEVSLQYAHLIMNSMSDSILHNLLSKKKFDLDNEEDKKELAYYITVELLAFQFASPVRWIETQDYFFRNGVERLIEVGPSTTLKGMAQRTLTLHATKYGFSSRVESLSFKTDKEAIYYEMDAQEKQRILQKIPPIKKPQVEQSKETATSASAASESSPKQVHEKKPVTTAPAPTPVPVSAPVVSSGVPASSTVSAFETLQVLLSVKLKKTLHEVTPDTTIKDLVGGKSAIQNEILGDLQKEYGQEPEGAATIPLKQLASLLGSSYTKLGPQSTKLVARVISSKMPAGFGLSEIQEYLNKERDTNDGQIESVLMHSMTMEPEARIDTTQKSKEWLDQVIDSYCTFRGVSIPRKSASGSGSGSAVVKAIDSEELYSYQRKHELLMKDKMNVYAKFLDMDLRSGDTEIEALTLLRQEIENDLNIWELEHGKAYAEGIRPIFDSNKIRRYNSYWNWARQEAFSLFYDTIWDNPARFDSNYCKRVFSLTNRATPELVLLVEDIAQRAYTEGNARVGRHVEALANQIRDHLNAAPVFRILTSNHDSPSIEIIKSDGRIVYSEVTRSGVRNFDEFVKEMRKGFLYTKKSSSMKKKSSSRGGKLVFQKKNNRPSSTNVSTSSSTTTSINGPASAHLSGGGVINAKRVPYIFLRAGKPDDPTDYDPSLTNTYYSVMSKLAPEGMTFQNKTALVTGCGRGSIGIEVVKGLLAGGARVIITTSRFTSDNTDVYRKIYEEHGAKDSELILFPFNQASSKDVNDLIGYIYDGLGYDLDYILPFAAVSEIGRDISNLDSLSELSHRVMLTNLLRLVGKVKSIKQERGIATNPSYIVLPLSPNHGVFGSDGLYAESKIGLETIFNKWGSEGWQNYLSITGAVIGWTRGTGLMEGNNMVAQGIEQLGVRTFNQSEMAYSILVLLAPEIVSASQKHPIWADITGGMMYIDNLKSVVSSLRSSIIESSELYKSIRSDHLIDQSLVVKSKTSKPDAITTSSVPLIPRANIQTKFPTLPTKERLEKLKNLRGMVDLEKTVVIVGIGEVGPWGSSRTRWDIESHGGDLSLEGCIELAWIMGLIKYHNGPLKDGQKYSGWIDAKSGSPVKDTDIKKNYEESIMKHCGIREIEPELFDGYNPHKKMFLHEVAIHHDLEPVEVFSKEEANQFKLEHGDKVNVYEKDGRWYVQMKKGSSMYIPRALKFDRFVAGQIPTGWDASRYGLPKDIIDQVDKVTLYNLVSTCEALINAGIIDPYEFYQYVHVSQVGNTAGGGIGGLNSIRKTYRERLLEKPVQADILQEIFINVMPAWVNLLLLSTSGPIKTPVGACATAAESVELGYDCIVSGKARIVIVGGYDDFGEESSYEFAQMKATSSAADEVRMGRTPKEMSRPVSDTRAGFMESQGAGTHILMDADLALKMGVPIYGIVALTNTATDKVGRSVPAPGRGLLTTAREKRSLYDMTAVPTSMLLDIDYRKRQLDMERESIMRWKEQEIQFLSKMGSPSDYMPFIDQQAERKLKSALQLWGNEFYIGNDSISPIRGALAVWGLTIDDVGVASFHGTGTKANDLNESQVTQLQMEHLGRKKGNGMLTIFQKYLTGHPKGAAAAWMLNGLCQSILSGVVPGNRNADNVDPKLRSCDYLVYTTKSIKTTGIKAGMLKSFGFGQASAEIIIIHPDYLFATIDSDTFDQYVERRRQREMKTYIFEQEVLCSKKKMIKVKDHPPYAPHDEVRVYLDPTARAVYDPQSATWKFEDKSNTKKPNGKEELNLQNQQQQSTTSTASTTAPIPKAVICSAATSVEVTMRELAEGLRQPTDRGIGVDVQLINEINIDDPNFIQRNFTESEISYCSSDSTNRDMIRARFAGRWAAKEAVIKAITSSIKDKSSQQSLWKGSASPLKDIEVLPSSMGAPIVILRDHALKVSQALAISDIKVTISHSGEYAVAHAVSR